MRSQVPKRAIIIISLLASHNCDAIFLFFSFFDQLWKRRLSLLLALFPYEIVVVKRSSLVEEKKKERKKKVSEKKTIRKRKMHIKMEREDRSKSLFLSHYLELEIATATVYLSRSLTHTHRLSQNYAHVCLNLAASFESWASYERGCKRWMDGWGDICDGDGGIHVL